MKSVTKQFVAAAVLLLTCPTDLVQHGNSQQSLMVSAQLRDISSNSASASSSLSAAAAYSQVKKNKKKSPPRIPVNPGDEGYNPAGPGKSGDHLPAHGDMGHMKGHGHTKGDGPEARTEINSVDHHERVHTGGKKQAHHDELHAQARLHAASNMERHGEAHLNEDHAPLPPGRVEETMYVNPKENVARESPLNLGPLNHTGHGHVEFGRPFYLDPHHDLTEAHLNDEAFKFDEEDPRKHPEHDEHETWRQETRDKHYEHRQWLKEYNEKHDIKSQHPRRNRPDHVKSELLGYHGEIREKNGEPHPSEKYDYIHWELEELRHEHDDAIHFYGENSEEAREIELLMRQLKSVDRAADYLDWGMPQEEFDQLVEWMNEYHEISHKKKAMSTDFKDGDDWDPNDPEGKAEAMHLFSEEMHKIEDRMIELTELITESKEHHHMLYKPIDDEGTIAERVKLRQLYEQVHNEHDRTKRKKLRNEYNERQQTLIDRRRLHSVSEEERALIQEIREKIHDTMDGHEKEELRHEIESIYSAHRDRRKEKGHMDDVHRPDLGYHRLEYNDMLDLNDEVLLDYHNQLRNTSSAEEVRQIKLKIRDRTHELHHDGKKHPRHGATA